MTHPLPSNPSIQRMVQELNEVFTPTLTTLASGSRDSRSAILWADGSAQPSPMEAERLQILHQMLTDLWAGGEDDQTIRNFAIGDNPQLGEAPVMVIRDACTNSARERIQVAVRALLEEAFA